MGKGKINPLGENAPHLRTAEIKKTNRTRYWQGLGGNGTHIDYRWGSEML